MENNIHYYTLILFSGHRIRYGNYSLISSDKLKKLLLKKLKTHFEWGRQILESFDDTGHKVNRTHQFGLCLYLQDADYNLFRGENAFQREI